MAKRMSTSSRMDRARKNGKASRIENGMRKRKERASRKARMLELIKKGNYPYTPSIMSWVSNELGKPTNQLTDAEVKALAN